MEGLKIGIFFRVWGLFLGDNYLFLIFGILWVGLLLFGLFVSGELNKWLFFSFFDFFDYF